MAKMPISKGRALPPPEERDPRLLEEPAFSGVFVGDGPGLSPEELARLEKESAKRSALVQEYVRRTAEAGEELDPDEIRGLLYGAL